MEVHSRAQRCCCDVEMTDSLKADFPLTQAVAAPAAARRARPLCARVRALRRWLARKKEPLPHQGWRTGYPTPRCWVAETGERVVQVLCACRYAPRTPRPPAARTAAAAPPRLQRPPPSPPRGLARGRRRRGAAPRARRGTLLAPGQPAAEVEVEERIGGLRNVYGRSGLWRRGL